VTFTVSSDISDKMRWSSCNYYNVEFSSNRAGKMHYLVRWCYLVLWSQDFCGK